MKICKICGGENDSMGPYCSGHCADVDNIVLCTECGAVVPTGKWTCAEHDPDTYYPNRDLGVE